MQSGNSAIALQLVCQWCIDCSKTQCTEGIHKNMCMILCLELERERANHTSQMVVVFLQEDAQNGTGEGVVWEPTQN